MSCGTCQHVESDLPEVSLRYSAPDRFYVNEHGDRFDVRSPLIRNDRSPTGGWRVSVVVNGQTLVVTGGSAKTVVKAVVALFKQNQQSVNLQDLWLNLNIQWLERTSEKYRLVSIEELVQFSTINN